MHKLTTVQVTIILKKYALYGLKLYYYHNKYTNGKPTGLDGKRTHIVMPTGPVGIMTNLPFLFLSDVSRSHCMPLHM